MRASTVPWGPAHQAIRRDPCHPAAVPRPRQGVLAAAKLRPDLRVRVRLVTPARHASRPSVVVACPCGDQRRRGTAAGPTGPCSIDNMTDPDRQYLLVTGGSGFIAGHCILQLLASGQRVRTTIRSTSREPALRSVLAWISRSRRRAVAATARPAGRPHAGHWLGRGRRGCQRHIHRRLTGAAGHVKDEDDVIVPAREGALRVLRAARDAGVRRLAPTSAFHAVGLGKDASTTCSPRRTRSPLQGPGMDA